MPKDVSRPSLPTSSSDFALHPTSSPGASCSSVTLDDPNYLLQRFRRPSLLSSRIHSPLASSFTIHGRRRSQSAAIIAEESESEKERMSTDSPSSSENATPPLKGFENGEEEPATARPKPSKPPLTPPRRRSSAASMDSDIPTIFNRRLYPLKQPRILKLLSEPRPEEDEVKSEAAFQRLLHSSSELPVPPRTPRPFADRGRYPEEAGHDEDNQREDSPSDDEDNDLTLEEPFAFTVPNPPTATQPINIVRRNAQTSSGSAAGSMNGDDSSMLMGTSEASSTSYQNMMDVDMVPGSPLLFSNNNNWRYTPPPTSSSAVRSNKRKMDDRYDPYPTSSKRRAVSPSLHYLRDNMSAMNSPIGRSNVNPRSYPIAIPINIPPSTASSAASSPTISSSAFTQYPRMASNTSSPTMRSTPMLLASPIIRPIPRRRQEGEEREVAGAGEAVNGLTLSE